MCKHTCELGQIEVMNIQPLHHAHVYAASIGHIGASVTHNPARETHCGKPAYRRDCGTMVLWICYAKASVDWCMVTNSGGAQQISYSCTCRSGHAWLDHGKLPVGRWLGSDGEVLCQIAYECKKKARYHSTIYKCLFSCHRLRSCLPHAYHHELMA